MHMSCGVLLVLVQMFLQLRFQYRDMSKLRISEPNNVQELRREIKVWERAAASISSYSKGEDLVRVTLLKKVKRLSKQLKSGSIPVESYRSTLSELQAKASLKKEHGLKFLLISKIISLSILFGTKSY